MSAWDDLKRAAAWTYPARSPRRVMMARSIRSISARTSEREAQSEGYGILYDYRMLRPFRYLSVLGAALAACAASADAQAVIDNDQVRVLKVTEQPHRKTRPH